MAKKFWKWNNSVEGTDSGLILEGPISNETWWGDEVTPSQFREELAEHKGPLLVVLNSGGGDVFAGMSIYNALREYDGDVTVRVDGLAASIASVIAMAADRVIMSPGSMMMIHKPWTMVAGDVNELDKAKQILNGIEDSILPIYTQRTGLSKDEVSALLEAETWLTAEQAVEMGFADEFIEAKQKSSFSDAIKSAMSGQFATQMAATKSSLEDFAKKLSDSTEKVEEDTNVVQTDTTTKVSAEVTEEPKTVETVEEPKLKGTTEPKAEKTTKTVKKEKPVMEDTTTAIAQDQVVPAPSAQAPVAEAPKKMSVKKYLNSKDSMEDFARILESHAGQEAADVRAAWKSHIETKLGVTNPEIFLPTALITEIENAFEDGGEIWSRVVKTGAEVFNSAWDSEDDVDSNDGRARGYRRSEAEEKAEQSLTFANRILRPQFVYKYITLNKEDIKNQRSTGALVRYVLSELPQRIVRELERAIVIGDGRASNDDYKIVEGDPQGFYNIKDDAAANAGAGNQFASTYTPEAGESRYDSMLLARDQLLASGGVVLICKKGFVTSVLLERNEMGQLLFAPGTDIATVLRLDAIIEPDWMDSDADNDAYLAVLSGYKTVGDNSIEAFTNFTLKTNKQEYLQEIWTGGGLTKKKSAVAIAAEASS